MAKRLGLLAIPVALAICLAAWPAAAQRPLAKVEITPEAIRWHPADEHPRLTLTLSGGGRSWSRVYKAGEPIVLELESKRGRIEDGAYKWELRADPKIDDTTREYLAEAREARDRGKEVDLRQLGLPARPLTQSGSFTVAKERIVAEREREAEPERRPEATQIVGDLRVGGNLMAEGKKAFIMDDPATPGARLVYVALEGPEAGTYLRGSAVTVGGEARIELPAHFAGATEPDGLTVQLTPKGAWSRLYVAEKSPELLIVRDADGRGGIGFDYLIHGVRRGFADHRVERGPDAD